MTKIEMPNTPAEDLVGEWVNLNRGFGDGMAVLAELDVDPSPESIPDDYQEWTISFDHGEGPMDLLWAGGGKYIITSRLNWRERVSFPPADQ